MAGAGGRADAVLYGYRLGKGTIALYVHVLVAAHCLVDEAAFLLPLAPLLPIFIFLELFDICALRKLELPHTSLGSRFRLGIYK